MWHHSGVYNQPISSSASDSDTHSTGTHCGLSNCLAFSFLLSLILSLWSFFLYSSHTISFSCMIIPSPLLLSSLCFCLLRIHFIFSLLLPFLVFLVFFPPFFIIPVFSVTFFAVLIFSLPLFSLFLVFYLSPFLTFFFFHLFSLSFSCHIFSFFSPWFLVVFYLNFFFFVSVCFSAFSSSYWENKLFRSHWKLYSRITKMFYEFYNNKII